MQQYASFLLTPQQRGSLSSLSKDPRLFPREQLRCTKGQGDKGVRSLSNVAGPQSGSCGGDVLGWDGGRGRRILTWLCWGSDQSASE